MKQLTVKFKRLLTLFVAWVFSTLFLFQNCSSKYNLSLEGNGAKTKEQSVIPPGEPITLIPNPSEVNIKLVTKMNYETRKDLKEIVNNVITSLGSLINSGE